MGAGSQIRLRIRKADEAELTRLARLYAGDQAVQQLIEDERKARVIKHLNSSKR